jgi:hypothetical protein
MRPKAALSAAPVPKACRAGAGGAREVGIRHNEKSRHTTPATKINMAPVSNGPRAKVSKSIQWPFINRKIIFHTI